MSTQQTISGRRMLPPRCGVTVRMYRLHGLGDCFLLAFRAKDGSGRYMLIDCGILTGTPDGALRLKAVAADIAAATAHHLHILVATHEHWDHLSGFQYAQAIFDFKNDFQKIEKESYAQSLFSSACEDLLK